MRQASFLGHSPPVPVFAPPPPPATETNLVPPGRACPPPPLIASLGECLPRARPAHAWRATFVLRILSLAPSISSPREVPQVDRTGPQTFPARHLA